MPYNKSILKVLFTLLLVGFMSTPLFADDFQQEEPYIVRTGNVFADIDTVNQIVYTIIDSGLWKYEIKSQNWDFIDSLSSFSNLFYEYEFGYNHYTKKLNIWSKGVGEVYEINPNLFSLLRIDNSFSHKNQNGHFPFFYDGTIHAYGGYGFWDWHGYITSYNTSTNEWSILTLNEKTKLPIKRIPHSGFYNSITNELFIFGGETSSGSGYDTRNLEKVILTDVWKLNFDNQTWTKVSEIDLKEFKFSRSFEVDAIRSKNKISSSFFSTETNIWYLPLSNEDINSKVAYLKPFDTKYGRALSNIEIPFDQNIYFLPANFLYNPKTKSAIFVGIEYLSNSTKLPVKVVSIPESELIAQIEKPSSFIGYSIYLMLGLILFVSFVFYFKLKNGENNKNLPELDIQDIDKVNWLNSDEKLIVELLYKSKKGLESQELEDSIWPHIVNYDYRRKLRNETVNSINKKYSSLFESKLELIIRNKDINDNRRFIFALNPDIILNSEK